MLCDKYMRKAFKEAPQSVVGYLLMSSWLYYYKPHCDPILKDETFDKACKWLHDNWDDVEHRYKSLISKDDLKAGTLYAVGSYSYPTHIRLMAETLSMAEGVPEWLDM